MVTRIYKFAIIEMEQVIFNLTLAGGGEVGGRNSGRRQRTSMASEAANSVIWEQIQVRQSH